MPLASLCHQATPVPGLTRDLCTSHEAPDQVRGALGRYQR